MASMSMIKATALSQGVAASSGTSIPAFERADSQSWRSCLQVSKWLMPPPEN